MTWAPSPKPAYSTRDVEVWGPKKPKPSGASAAAQMPAAAAKHPTPAASRPAAAAVAAAAGAATAASSAVTPTAVLMSAPAGPDGAGLAAIVQAAVAQAMAPLQKRVECIQDELRSMKERELFGEDGDEDEDEDEAMADSSKRPAESLGLEGRPGRRLRVSGVGDARAFLFHRSG